MVTLVNTSYNINKSRDQLFISQNQLGASGLSTPIAIKPNFVLLPDYDPSALQSLLLERVAHPAEKDLYLVLVPALLAFPVLTWLFTRVQLDVVNTIAYAVPVVALVLGWLLLGEQVTGRTFVAVVVILAGVVMIVWSARRQAEPEPELEAAEAAA